MKKHLLVGLLALSIVGATVASQTIHQSSPHPSGTITGKLLDAAGQPVAGAVVTADFQGSWLGALPNALTDRQGDFSITNAPPGTYIMEAEKKKDGYPPTKFFYYTVEELKELNQPKVEVHDQQTVRDVIVHLGKRGAWVAGRVVDASTQKLIENAGLHFKTANASENSILMEDDRSEDEQREGRFKMLVPSAPFTFEVTAPGYEKWIYSDDNSGRYEDTLQLKSGEVRKFKIELHGSRPSTK